MAKSRNQTAVLLAMSVAFSLSMGCGTFKAQRQIAPELDKSSKQILFMGSYDARVQLGNVKTHETVTSLGSQPMYTSDGYAGNYYYPKSETVRTGEIPPNEILRSFQEGFVEVADGELALKDVSSAVPLESRNEMGMDWYANKHGVTGYLVSFEIKEAKMELEDSRTTRSLGTWALVLGIASPCFLFTTLPCLIYLPFAETTVPAYASGTLHIYDASQGEVVARVPVKISVTFKEDGFFDEDSIYKQVGAELGRRLGHAAVVEAFKRAR